MSKYIELTNAIEENNTDAVRKLLEDQSLISQPEKAVAFLMAAHYGNMEIVKVFLQEEQGLIAENREYALLSAVEGHCDKKEGYGNDHREIIDELLRSEHKLLSSDIHIASCEAKESKADEDIIKILEEAYDRTFEEEKAKRKTIKENKLIEEKVREDKNRHNKLKLTGIVALALTCALCLLLAITALILFPASAMLAAIIGFSAGAFISATSAVALGINRHLDMKKIEDNPKETELLSLSRQVTQQDQRLDQEISPR